VPLHWVDGIEEITSALEHAARNGSSKEQSWISSVAYMTIPVGRGNGGK
jgi:hypothetical protein